MILHPGRHSLAPLMQPRSVAVVGATETPNKLGEVVVSNMVAAQYRGELFAVNPKYRSVHGVPCFASPGALPHPVDLAVVVTPAATVPGVIEQCGAAGVRTAVVLTAGFSEVGAEGKRLERELLANARRHGMRILGPNCLGLLRPGIGLNAAFARARPIRGSLGLISQSGALCAAMLDWAEPYGIGFSSVVSLGGSADLDFGELVDFLANDPETEHILLYIEGVRDARRFMSSLRSAARMKPVIVMKVGRHSVGSRAAVSHTGAIIGLDDVFDAAVRRVGAVRVHSIGQLVAAADALSAHVHPSGERLAIITNGGGPGVMAADCAADLRLPLAELSASTLDALHGKLPSNWSHGNPVDLIGDADAERYRAAVAACVADENVDGILAILTPQAMTDADAAARAVSEAWRGSKKPLIACWMGEASVAPARSLLKAAGIPTFRTPDPAVEVFAHVSAFYKSQQQLLQAPPPLAHQEPPDVAAARHIVAAALAQGRTLLDSAEAKALLAAFRIPVTRTLAAATAEEAERLAPTLGFPIAMKIDSPDITHKTDAGGVRLNVSPGEVRAAFEAMLAEVGRRQPGARLDGVTLEPMMVRPYARELFAGVLRDPVFGPAIAFGAGGTAIEVHRDRTVALPPLNAFLAAEMIRGTRINAMLSAFRGMPAADCEAVQAVLLRLSELVCEVPEVDELDINPLLVDEHGATALDVRVRIREAPAAAGRYGHMAIHPYPAGLVSHWTTRSGQRVELRPIRPEDAAIEAEFVRGLSEQTRYLRFMSAVRDLTPSMLSRFTQIDYDREMALIAVVDSGGREREIAVGRYVTNPDGVSCEFAIVVADEWQHSGLGSHMLALLSDIARSRGLSAMVGYVLSANRPMLALCQRLGFEIEPNADDPGVKRAVLKLAA